MLIAWSPLCNYESIKVGQSKWDNQHINSTGINQLGSRAGEFIHQPGTVITADNQINVLLLANVRHAISELTMHNGSIRYGIISINRQFFHK